MVDSSRMVHPVSNVPFIDNDTPETPSASLGVEDNIDGDLGCNHEPEDRFLDAYYESRTEIEDFGE